MKNLFQDVPKYSPSSPVTPIIFLRHGVGSSSTPFTGLASYLQTQFPTAEINNESYSWRHSILVNAARLASQVVSKGSPRPCFLIGHSMGGLICRLANCFLGGHGVDEKALYELGYNAVDTDEAYGLVGPPDNPLLKYAEVLGVITLATPNSGALLQGQLSLWAAAAQGLVNTIFPNFRVESFTDLSTDRLFHVMKGYAVKTPVLSVSGSYMNRFRTGSGQLASWLGLGGITLDMPHDTIVEDRSVDLTQSILPNEITHNGSGKYIHLRAYDTCTEVRHTNIYDDDTVRKTIVDFIRANL